MLSLTAFFRECSCFFRFLAVLSLFFKSTYTQKILSRFLKISPHPSLPFPILSYKRRAPSRVLFCLEGQCSCYSFSIYSKVFSFKTLPSSSQQLPTKISTPPPSK
uniref:Uncharacterized protein n=1 Tax=Meloidogyne enterolobii TaxID=390850 RepID=A0A6V7W697_MELEN|nr:unnamed protein product [Meloidogyne enterolobii]